MSRFTDWAGEPIRVPRWAILLKYVLFSVAGILVSVIGSSTLSRTTGAAYAVLWAVVMIGAGALAAVGLVSVRLEFFEFVGALIAVLWTLVLILEALAIGIPLFSAYLSLAISVPLGRVVVIGQDWYCVWWRRRKGHQ